MATVSDGYVDVRTDQAKAETELTVARALLTIEEKLSAQTRWIVGFILVAAGLVIAVLR